MWNLQAKVALLDQDHIATVGAQLQVRGWEGEGRERERERELLFFPPLAGSIITHESG